MSEGQMVIHYPGHVLVFGATKAAVKMPNSEKELVTSSHSHFTDGIETKMKYPRSLN